MADFLQEFFIQPLLQRSGFNPVNTLVYAAIAIAIMFGLIYPYLNRRGVKFDFNFFIALLPYIVLGSAIRVLEEPYSNAHVLARSVNPIEPGFWVITPGIYVTIAVFAVLSLLFSLWISRKSPKNDFSYLKPFQIIGAVPAAILVIFCLSRITQPLHFVLILCLAFVSFGAVFLVLKALKSKLLSSNLNKAVLFGQCLDASSTFAALQFFSGFMEQHFLPRAVMGSLGPISFYFLKIPLVLLVLYFVDRYVEDKNLGGFIKFFVAVLGFATGTRDLFSVGLTLLS